MLFVQRAGGEGALAGALGAQGEEGPAGVGSLEDQTLGARGFRSVSQKCPLDGSPGLGWGGRLGRGREHRTLGWGQSSQWRGTGGRPGQACAPASLPSWVTAGAP